MFDQTSDKVNPHVRPLDGMIVHRRVTHDSTSPVPIYTPEQRKAIKWNKVSFLREQYSNAETNLSKQKSSALTTTHVHHCAAAKW